MLTTKKVNSYVVETVGEGIKEGGSGGKRA